MQKVKVVAVLAVLVAAVAAVLRKRELAAAGEWQTLGASPSRPTPAASVPETQDEIDIERGVAEGLPVSDRFAATPDPTSDPLPEGYDPLTDPIPPNEL